MNLSKDKKILRMRLWLEVFCAGAAAVIHSIAVLVAVIFTGAMSTCSPKPRPTLGVQDQISRVVNFQYLRASGDCCFCVCSPIVSNAEPAIPGSRFEVAVSQESEFRSMAVGSCVEERLLVWSPVLKVYHITAAFRFSKEDPIMVGRN